MRGRLTDKTALKALCGSMLLLLAVVPNAFAAEESGQSPLVSVSLGLMIWTLVAFVITLLVLRKAFFPKIQEFLDKRRKLIQDSIDSADQMRKEADELLEEYRQRLAEARKQADEIVASARKAGETRQQEALAEAKAKSGELINKARGDIETETRLALEKIRKEVADLTVIATEKVTRKALDKDDHKRLIEDALNEVDFATLGSGSEN